VLILNNLRSPRLKKALFWSFFCRLSCILNFFVAVFFASPSNFSPLEVNAEGVCLLSNWASFLFPFLLLTPYFFLFLFLIFLLAYVWKSVNILVCLPAGKRKPPAGEGYSGEPQVVSHSVART